MSAGFSGPRGDLNVSLWGSVEWRLADAVVRLGTAGNAGGVSYPVGGGRALQRFLVEARFRRLGTAGTVPTAFAVGLVPEGLPPRGGDPDAGLAEDAVFATLEEDPAGTRLHLNGLLGIGVGGLTVPPAALGAEGSIITLQLEYSPATREARVWVNTTLVALGYARPTFDSYRASLVAGGIPSASRQFDLVGLAANWDHWTTAPFFMRQPVDIIQRVGYQRVLEADPNDPLVTDLQWQRRREGETGFSKLPGETGIFLLVNTPVATDRYRCMASSPYGVVTSNEATITPADLTVAAGAPVNLHFNGTSAASAGTGAALITLAGAANILPGTGPDGSGALWLTDGSLGQAGAITIADANGADGEGGCLFNARVRVAGGTDPPADGFSVSWGSDVPANPPFSAWEEGLGSGWRVAFDIFDNGGGEAPAVDVFYRNELLAHRTVPLELIHGPSWADVAIRVRASGLVDVAWNGNILHWAVNTRSWLPQNFSGARWAIAARTGALSAEVAIDDIRLSVFPAAAVPQITSQPVPVTTPLGGRAEFSIGLAKPAEAQVTWRLLVGASSRDLLRAGGTRLVLDPVPYYGFFSMAVVADVTSAGGIVTSQPAALTVLPIPGLGMTTKIAQNEATAPAGSSLLGNALWEPSSRAGEISAVRLTSPDMGQSGTFLLPDLDPGRKVVAWRADFQMRVHDWSWPPADGWSFCWGTGLGGLLFGEEGAGSGLVVSVDSFDNNEGYPFPEAPSISIRWQGATLFEGHVALEELLTAEDFVPVTAYLDSVGRFSLWYNRRQLAAGLQLPGYAGLANARFGWGARTGLYYAGHVLRAIEIGTVGAPPFLAIRRDGNQVVLDFEGILESSGTMLPGDWWPISDSSPFREDAVQGTGPDDPYVAPRKFYRAVTP